MASVLHHILTGKTGPFFYFFLRKDVHRSMFNFRGKQICIPLKLPVQLFSSFSIEKRRQLNTRSIFPTFAPRPAFRAALNVTVSSGSIPEPRGMGLRCIRARLWSSYRSALELNRKLRHHQF